MKKTPAGNRSFEGLEQENARLRGDLLTVAMRISHDLRTPLGGIISAGEVFKEIHAESASSSLADSLLRSSEEMAGLIKRTSSVLRASACPREKEPVMMEQVVSAVLSQLERRGLAMNATITQPESWPTVCGVSAWLEIIWWNLLANALQHAGPAPKIKFGWDSEGQGKGEGVRFWISDNGDGVPENGRAGLFQSFESLHQTDGARGLGLSIVRRLVELQGGGCGYEPRPEGAFFYFTLPGDKAVETPAGLSPGSGTT
jgi:signal transduction histidine kinase